MQTRLARTRAARNNAIAPSTAEHASNPPSKENASNSKVELNPPTTSIKTRSKSNNTLVIPSIQSQNPPTKRQNSIPQKRKNPQPNPKQNSTIKPPTASTQTRLPSTSHPNPLTPSNDSQAHTITRVVIPLRSTLKTQESFKEPADPPRPAFNHTLPEPSSSKSNLQRTAPSLPLDPHSHASRLPQVVPSNPIPKKELSRKRLFEDADTSSQDIFSFLDRRPHLNKRAKPARRTVFKSSQPSLLKSNKPPETDTNKDKRRALASSKLLAGSQPHAKRLQKTLPKEASTSVRSQALSIPQEPHLKLEQQPTTHPSSPSLQLPAARDSSLPPLSESNDQNPTVNQKPHALSLSPSSQSHPITPIDQPLPTVKDSDLLPSSNIALASLTSVSAPIDQPTSEVRPFKPTSTHPPTDSPLSCPTPPLDPTDQDAATSADAIGSRSPKPSIDKTLKTFKDTYDSQSSCLPPLKSNSQSSDAVNPSDSIAEPHQPSTTPPLEITAVRAAKPSNKILDQDSASQSNLNGQADTPLSPKAQGTINHASLLNQALVVQVAPSQIPDSSANISLDPDIKSTEALNQQALPLNSSSSLVENAAKPSQPVLSTGSATPPIGADALDDKVERSPTTPKSSPRLIPKRTSPIKHPTLPTSIPIMAPTPPLAPTPFGNNQPLKPELSRPQVPIYPSMLPRRALNQTMGTSQPLICNAVPSLDAIIETSPEKRPVRDALSAASLSRSRGFGLPPRMIFTGGIKSKTNATFLRPMPGGSSLTFTNRPVGGINQVGQAAVQSQGENQSAEISSTITEQKNQAEDHVHPEDAEAVEEEEEENRSIDTSSTSINTQRSTASSNVSTRTHSQSEKGFSGNISIDTQDRLMKLQNMLARMGRAESSDASNTSIFSNEHFPQKQYREYEVDVKNDDDDQHKCENQTVQTSYSTRSCRRRSSSVPLNYSENTTLSKSVSSRSQSVAANTFITAEGSISKNQSRGIPVARRRVSNILPSATVDSLQSRAVNQHDPGSSNATSLVNNAQSAETSTSAGVAGHAGPSNGKSRRNSVHGTFPTHHTPAPLKNVVAFVDVRTAEGDDAGKVFVEMLKGLGAKVVGRPVFPLTHIIFKAGRQSTIERYMIHPRPKPQLVGIGWIVRCREILSKAEEGPYKIDINSSQVPFNLEQPRITSCNTNDVNTQSKTANNRRKSMEPKALSLLNSAIQLNLSSSDQNFLYQSSSNSSSNFDFLRPPLGRSCINKQVTGPINSTTTATTEGMIKNNGDQVLAQALDKARRKSLQFLPKVGSPLANKVSTINPLSPT